MKSFGLYLLDFVLCRHIILYYKSFIRKIIKVHFNFMQIEDQVKEIRNKVKFAREILMYTPRR